MPISQNPSGCCGCCRAMLARKTVVALLAAATAIEAGRQAALMRDRKSLARQHLKTIAPLAEAAGCALQSSPAARKARYARTF